MKISLPEIAILRPVTITMCVLTVLGLGGIAASRMPLEFMPAFQLPFLGVFIPYPGATPAQVEQEIAIPAEGEFRTLPNLSRLYSNSSGDGCFINFSFEEGVDLSEALADVRDRIERLRLDLPQDIDNIFIQHFNTDQLPVMQVGLAREGDDEEFAHLLRTSLLPKLQRLDGVAEVQFWGNPENSIVVEFDQNALMAHGLSIYQIMNTLQTSSVNLSAGELPDGKKKYLVRTIGEFRAPAEIAGLTIGSGLRLKDVANVGYKSREEESFSAIDGTRQFFLIVTKESEANTVAVCEEVERELENTLATTAFRGVEKFIFFNQGDIILQALGGLQESGLYGGLMAVAVLIVFLGRVRPTLVVALSIPGSLVCGLVFMYFVGMNLNLITMMSLIIAVGIVVDDSIVVIENIYRYRALGYNALDSARQGSKEVSLAIVASTATAVVVFVPVVFVENGQMAIFMRQFATPVSISMVASLVIALTVIPLAASRFHDRKSRAAVRSGAENVEVKEQTRRRFWNPHFVLSWSYEGLLRLSIRWRLVSVIVMAIIGALTYYFPFKNLGLQAVPDVDMRMVDISFEFDPNYDMAKAQHVIDSVEAQIEARREALGIKNVLKRYTARGGDMQVFLVQTEDLPEGTELPYTSEEVMKVLWTTLPSQVPGGEIRFSSGGGQSGGDSGQKTVTVRLQGDDAPTLDEYAEQLMGIIRTFPDVTEVETNSQRPDQEIRLDIDEVLAERSGINATMVAQTVGFALMGTRLPSIKHGEREVPVWAQFREEDRQTKGNLDNVMISGTSGALIPLNRLVNFQKADSPRTITRVDGKNYVTITATTSNTDLAPVRAALGKLADEFVLPPGYSISLGDELLNLDENLAGFVSTLVLALALIYIVMAALFESLFLPLSILTTVPLAFIGVYWCLYLTGTPLDVVAFIGCVFMVGVVVKNGIVIVDRINNLRIAGLPRYDAVIQAGRDRLRPVLMTALTTILGAVPLAFGGHGEAGEVRSLGLALIGGLTTGTVLTLFIVPLFYTFIDDVQEWSLQFIANVAGLGNRAPKKPAF